MGEPVNPIRTRWKAIGAHVYVYGYQEDGSYHVATAMSSELAELIAWEHNEHVDQLSEGA
jgi:hypothetical protein